MGVENDDSSARAYLIAHELIEQHGNDVARFLQAKIDEMMGTRDLEQLPAGFVNRNAGTLILEAESKLH